MIFVYDNPTLLSQALAQFFIDKCKESIKERGKFTVCLTGGSSPKELYKLLSSPPISNQIDWQKVFVFWGDERMVADNDVQNNGQMTFDALLNNVPVPANQIFRMNGNLSPDAAAVAYDKILKEFFQVEGPGFDLILLGMGENAHTASLFPYTSALTEHTAWVKGLYIEEVKMNRLTLTAPFINMAREIVFIVFGANKAQTLHEVLEGDRDIQLKPAQLIVPVDGNLRWFLDTKASSDLSTAILSAIV